ncbi:MAG: nucleoside hydrolase [Tepidiformaceae bacterium]
MASVKVHLDTDIGGDIDDLCALALLLAWPGVEITGVTTELEHGGKRAGYARYALELAGRGDVPVAAGADVGLGCFRQGEYGFPPEARYWPEPVSSAPGPLETALDLLEESIERAAIVVAIGPFTNLSLLERRSPGALRRAQLCLMGGSIVPAPPGFPAWDHEMDFNTQSDAAAALHVLEAADPERITIVPLEVTAQTALRRAHLPALRRSGPLGALLAGRAEAFAVDENHEERYGRSCAGFARRHHQLPPRPACLRGRAGLGWREGGGAAIGAGDGGRLVPRAHCRWRPPPARGDSLARRQVQRDVGGHSDGTGVMSRES